MSSTLFANVFGGVNEDKRGNAQFVNENYDWLDRIIPIASIITKKCL